MDVITHAWDKQLRCREAIQGLGFCGGTDGCSATCCQGEAAPKEHPASHEQGCPCRAGSPNHEESCPKSSTSMQKHGNSSVPGVRHQLFLGIKTPTCHPHKPTTYRGLIKSPKGPGNWNTQKPINAAHKTMWLLLAKVYWAIK